MEHTKTIIGVTPDDAELVDATRRGDRDAFSEIVARYQGLICSLTYSGTGSISRSEEIAQETFVTAWRRLYELREPASLRAWLCGIARNLVSNFQRRAGREPAEIAGPLDPAHEPVAPDPSPSDQVMRKEEESILWQAVGRIPENYREPLILYYREHHSVEQVADKLGLTVDATKQRLSRGRALLHEQVLAFVESTLERTKPRAAFTSAVMSALPLLAPSLAASAGGSTIQGATAAKAGTAGSLAFFPAVLGFFAAIGGYVGWQMSDAHAQSTWERVWSARFWRAVVLATFAVILPVLILLIVAGRAQPWVSTALSYYLLAGHIVIAVPFGVWAWENHRRIRARSGQSHTAGTTVRLLGATLAFVALAVAGTLRFGFPSGSWTDLWLTFVFALAVMSIAVCVWALRPRPNGGNASPADPAQPSPRPVSLAWVAVATLSTVALLLASIGGGWRRAERVPPPIAREIIATHAHPKVRVLEYERGVGTITIDVDEKGRTKRYLSPADEATLAALKQADRPYETLRQGRDFERLGAPGRSLFLLSLITTTAGIVLVVRELRRRLNGPKHGSPGERDMWGQPSDHRV